MILKVKRYVEVEQEVNVEINIPEHLVQQIQKIIIDQRITHIDEITDLFAEQPFYDLIHNAVRKEIGHDEFSYDTDCDEYECDYKFKAYKETCCDEWESYQYCPVCGNKIK